MERQDHNEMTCAYWREVFLKLDHGDLIRRFALENDEKALYITYFCRRYRIDRATGWEEKPSASDASSRSSRFFLRT